MVGNDQPDVGGEFLVAPPPQQFLQGMVGFGNEDGYTLVMWREHHAVLHVEGLRNLVGERLFEGLTGSIGEIRGIRSELHAHEERSALGIGTVLLRVEHVGTASSKEPGHGGYDAGPVGTCNQ